MPRGGGGGYRAQALLAERPTAPDPGWDPPPVYPDDRGVRRDPGGHRAAGLLALCAVTVIVLLIVSFAFLRSGPESEVDAGEQADPVLPAVAEPASPGLVEADAARAGTIVASTLTVGPSSTSAGADGSAASASDPTSTSAVATTSPPLAVAPSTAAPTTATTVATSASSATTAEQTTLTTTATTEPGSSSTTVASTTTISDSPANDGAIQQAVLDATNSERAAAGCQPLRLDPVLNEVADGHSEDMAARGYFSHDDPEGNGPGSRIDASGYPYWGWGENIAAGQRTPAKVVEAWMNSEGHRRNILDCDFDELGVGYAEGGPYGLYWTQVFGTRR